MLSGSNSKHCHDVAAIHEQNHNQNFSPSTKALLEPNADFLFPQHRSINRSPYEVKDTPFYEIDPILLASMKNIKLIGIDNFDPNDPTKFTDPYTIKAIKKLGINESDLFYPTQEDLEKFGYSGDLYYKERLMMKVRKHIEGVKAAREKIIKMEMNSNKADILNIKSKSNRGISENKPPIHYPSAKFEKKKRETSNSRVDKYRGNATLSNSDVRSSMDKLLPHLNYHTKFDVHQKHNNKCIESSEISERIVSKDRPKVKTPIKQKANHDNRSIYKVITK